MLIEVINQHELHNINFNTHKCFLAHFNNYSIHNAEYLKTSIKNSDSAVINNLKKHCNNLNLSNHKELISLKRVNLINGFFKEQILPIK